MHSDEEMDGQSVKSDIDGETGETKEDEDCTHMDAESCENYEQLQEEDNTPVNIYIIERRLPKDGLYTDALVDKRRKLKQSSCRTATAVNKHLNFRVKKQPQTTDCLYVLHI